MAMKYIFLLLVSVSILSGCASSKKNDQLQKPAPVYRYGSEVNDSTVQTQGYENSTSGIATKPLILEEQVPKETMLQEDGDGKLDLINDVAYVASLPPPLNALVAEANQSVLTGDYEAAVATLERAHRIRPRNPRLLHQLAKIRLQQNKPGLAEELAKKSLLLAAGKDQIKQQNWVLIAKARAARGDVSGEKEAQMKARKY